MCWDYETTTYSVAKNAYRCEACEWLNNIPIDEGDLSEKEIQTLADAKADGYKILPGQKYIKTRGLWEGKWETFGARIDVNQICQDHGIYDC